jgi:hypothetical protein
VISYSTHYQLAWRSFLPDHPILQSCCPKLIRPRFPQAAIPVQIGAETGMSPGLAYPRKRWPKAETQELQNAAKLLNLIK